MRAIFLNGSLTGLTDGQLIERYALRDGESAESAFAALVARHGAMVWCTCRAVLHDEHEAGDAFQAVFLVLVRKAQSLWGRESLGPWLHRVAIRAAVQARREANRRKQAERRTAELAPGWIEGDAPDDLADVVHQEIDRLPERHRIPVVLCDIEGRSYEEAARHLKCPVGTVKSRLARARRRLGDALRRRGVAAATAWQAIPAASSVVPPQVLTASAIRSSIVTEAVSKTAFILAQGVLRTMIRAKIQSAIVGGVAVLGLVSTGWLAIAGQEAVDAPKKVEAPAVARTPAMPRLASSWKEKDARVVLFSPDGRLLISSGGDGRQLRDAATGRVRAVLSGPRSPLYGPQFSPDGRLLYAAIGSDEFKPVRVQDLMVWDVETGRVRARFGYIAEGMNDETFALSGDGSRLAFMDNSERLPMQVRTGKISDFRQSIDLSFNVNPGLPRVVVWDVPDWKRIALVDGGPSLAFSHDGKTLVTGDRNFKKPGGKVWDASTGLLRLELKDLAPGVGPLVVSPDGRLVASAGGNKTQALWDLADGRRWAIETKGWSRKPVFSRGGNLLLSTGSPHIGQGQEYDAFNLAAMPPSRLNLASGELILSPDGRRYAVVQGDRHNRDSRIAVTLYELPSMREKSRFEMKNLDGGEFSPDGRRLALQTYRHTDSGYFPEIRLFDSDTARLLYTISSPDKVWGAYSWKFSPDGNALAVYYRTGSNQYRDGEPDPSDRPMNVDVWELPRQ